MKLDLGNIIGQVMGSNADGMSDIITAVLTSEPAQLKQLLAGLLKGQVKFRSVMKRSLYYRIGLLMEYQ